jgi:hypothetical protein
MLKVLYLLVSGATLGLLFIEAPTGNLLTTTPEKGQVGSSPSGGSSVRGRGPTFIYLGGGYKGGK